MAKKQQAFHCFNNSQKQLYCCTAVFSGELHRVRLSPLAHSFLGLGLERYADACSADPRGVFASWLHLNACTIAQAGRARLKLRLALLVAS